MENNDTDGPSVIRYQSSRGWLTPPPWGAGNLKSSFVPEGLFIGVTFERTQTNIKSEQHPSRTQHKTQKDRQQQDHLIVLLFL